MKNEVIAAMKLEKAIYDRITDEEIAKSDMTTLLVDQIQHILETEKDAKVFVGKDFDTTVHVIIDNHNDILTGCVEFVDNAGEATFDDFERENEAGFEFIARVVAHAVKWRLASIRTAERIEKLIQFIEMDSDSIAWDAVE